MKKLLSIILILSMMLSLVSCFKQSSDNDKSVENEISEQDNSKLNDVELKQYSIVYNAEDLDYSKRAAEYIKTQILARTSHELQLIEDDAEAVTEYEIVVGNTNRAISEQLDAHTEGLQFAILADNKSIALEGDYFIIAAAAYFFIETYVPGNDFSADVPTEVTIHEPIVEEAKNYIMLIGDGMGVFHTRSFEFITNDIDYGDGEDIFYGYYLPYVGYSRTISLDGVTDSAAGGTALSTGHKTHNGYLGLDKDEKPIKSFTELAYDLGMSAGVMSTETDTGATPSSFFAHVNSRHAYADIMAEYRSAIETYGTYIDCGFDYYTPRYVNVGERHVTDMLKKLEANENGFFLMYEEAHIDKYSHNNNLEGMFKAMVRFNQAIGRFMEYAFYNPDTFIIITADHETGNLSPNADGELEFHSDQHTASDVQIFAYGYGAEIFDGKHIENIQIAHTIASMLGVDDFGDQSVYQSLFKE